MGYRRTKLYPTISAFQHSSEKQLPLKQAITYLNQLLLSIPEAERDSAFIDNWDNLSIYYDKHMSTLELMNEAMDEISQIVAAAKNRPLTREEVDRIATLTGRNL